LDYNPIVTPTKFPVNQLLEGNQLYCVYKMQKKRIIYAFLKS
jgi:hypothetical protein